MTQSNLNVDGDQAASLVLVDLNAALQALASLSSGPTAPTTTYANMLWYDTAAGVIKQRNAADDAWVAIGAIDEDDFASDSATRPPSQQSTKAYVDGQDIGVGQTWQDVIGSRAKATSYQNTTGKPIQLSISWDSASVVNYIQVSSDNATWIDVATSQTDPITCNVIVPDDWYYRVNESGGTVSISRWAELR